MSHAFGKFDLRGKTALVTGGGAGVGYNISRALARAGATVLICSRREQVLKDAAQELKKDPLVGSILHHTVDLADAQSVNGLIEHVLKTVGGVDIFVGNAAISCFEMLENIKDESIDTMCAVNLASNVKLVRAFAPGMRKKHWGRVIFISSLLSAGASPYEGAGMYSAVKGALNAFTRTMAVETGRDGITVNSLNLGPFLTDLTRNYLEQMDREHGVGAAQAAMNDFCIMSAVGRMPDCEEVEGIIQLLASDAGSFITGQNIGVDGGMGIVLRPYAREPSASAA